MKTLYLVRHSKAEQRDAKKADFERSLIKKGRKDAATMAARLKRSKAIPDIMISSPANRAMQTARVFSKVLKFPDDKIVANETIYEELRPESFLDVVRGIDGKYDSAMLFGHDPLFSTFANFLREDFTEQLPKTAVVCFEFNNRSWKTIAKGQGIVRSFDHPRKSENGTGNETVYLQSQILEPLQATLAKVNPEAAARMRRSVTRASRELARELIKRIKKIEKKGIKKAAKQNKSAAKKGKKTGRAVTVAKSAKSRATAAAKTTSATAKTRTKALAAAARRRIANSSTERKRSNPTTAGG